MKLDIPAIIGHRGARGRAPENTLAGIRKARALGARWVELDVKLTKDSQAVIIHDDSVDRTCAGGSGRVREMTLADIRALDAGEGEGVPTLEEALDTVIDEGLGLNLEIKPCSGRARETAEVALDVLSRSLDGDSQVLVSSFNITALEACVEMLPEVPRGLLWESLPEEWADIASAFQAATIHLAADRLKDGQISAVRAAGYPVLAYTVNDPGQAKKLWKEGASALFTDEPDTLLALLKG